MTQMQGKPRRSYASAGAYVYGTSALKQEAPAYIPSYENAAPRPRRQEEPRRTLHRSYFESAQQKTQPRAQARVDAKGQARTFSKGRIMLVSLFAVVVTMGFLWLYQAAEYSALTQSVADMRASIKEQTQTNRELSQQLETLKDGERIRTYAVNKLGMIAPGKGEERTISIILPRTQEPIVNTQEEKHYTLLDVLLDMLWF